ncbi:MAG TPA: DJ-1/PfpI family protein [Bdellovibrionota bacterium]|nr:DJ-1/PfpI family protein [Bdellovibrionota bacterium]
MHVAIILSAKGYHWVEVAEAVRVFENAGISFELFTPEGMGADPDPFSIETKPFLNLLGFGTPSSIAPETNFGTELAMKIWEAKPFSDLDPKNFDGVYLPGGHGCLFDVNPNATVHKKLRSFAKAGKPIALVCHSTSTIALTDPGLVKGKAITGFPDFIDRLLVKFKMVHPQFLPIPLNNQQELIKAGALHSFWKTCRAVFNPCYMVRDGNLISGVGPRAAKGVARALIRAFQSPSS